jgi:hypothetical protein
MGDAHRGQALADEPHHGLLEAKATLQHERPQVGARVEALGLVVGQEAAVPPEAVEPVEERIVVAVVAGATGRDPGVPGVGTVGDDLAARLVEDQGRLAHGRRVQRHPPA